MTEKKQSPAAPASAGGSDSKSNRDTDGSSVARVSQTALRYSCCTNCNKISVEGVGYYVLKPGGIVRRAICRKCAEAQVPKVGYPANGHLALWLKARLRGRHWCEPVCAGCGSDARAETFGFYDYWPEQHGALPETVFFDLCHACAIALSSSSALADHLRTALAVNGFLVARQKSFDRVQRGLESMLQHPSRGSAT